LLVTKSHYALLIAFIAMQNAACDSDPTGHCIFNHMVGEMEIELRITDVKVSIQVYLIGEGRSRPLEGSEIEVFSSRNTRDDIVDIVRQPESPTDEYGRVLAYIDPKCRGEAHITATADGAFLCESWKENRCSLLVQTIFIDHICIEPMIDCGCECVDVTNDLDHCGGCDLHCSYENASAACVDGICIIGECDIGCGDCNGLEHDGCEADLLSDDENCGSCGNSCDDGSDCTDDSCDGTGACLNQFNANPCEDGNPYTLWDTCHFGVCLGGGGLPDTGQRLCYNDSEEIDCQGTPGDPDCGATEWCGQDAQYGWDTEHDSSERYSVVDPIGNGEEVVIDHMTGIHWQRIIETDKTWQEAVDYCENLIFSGYDDWFLSDIHQLHSIVDYGNYGPAIDTNAFPGVHSVWLWSSSYEVQLYGTYAWQVRFRDGSVDMWDTVEYSGVRCARSDWNMQPEQSERFLRFDPVENTPVVIDRFTGLMWQGCQNGFSGSDCEIGTNPQVRYWDSALRMCEDLDWGGYYDWYLPNVRELFSLMDTEQEGTFINTEFFPQPEPLMASNWTSTTWLELSITPLRAHIVNFYRGEVGAGRKDVATHVMCVRRSNSF
jgi:hypothetical protein